MSTLPGSENKNRVLLVRSKAFDAKCGYLSAKLYKQLYVIRQGDFMQYKKLNFEDYFTICSDNYNQLDTNLELAKYESILYEYRSKQFSVEFQVRFDEFRNCIQVIMQQTASKSDWRVNFSFPAKIYDKFTFDSKLIQLKVHRGWGNMWLVCQSTIRQKIKVLLDMHPDAFVEVFGWSLGSALAQLAAEDIYFKFGIKPYLYTYGSVKPFYGKDTYNFVKSCCEDAYNFYDHCDIVGYMVPFFGWKAISHCKVKLEDFCITKLFKPAIYHGKYDTQGQYKDYE